MRMKHVLKNLPILVAAMQLCIASAMSATDHWAYQKPVDPAIPVVKNSAWIKNPIDNFILAKLETAHLTPAPAVDKRTLIRRAYFDLIGLPPAPEQVDAFMADASPEAFSKVVDGLLADPRYGERWARYWLDVARYSDTKGYVFEEERRYPYAYTYRDYVIRSFNEDKPYDRFLMEQIAADLLPLGDDKRPLAAMGFLTLGRRFLNAKPDIIDDRMDVVCRGTMGVTIGCARCHNHKFDPIPTKDYYSLYAIFNNSVESKDPPLIGEPEHNAAYDAFQQGLNDLQAAVDQYLQKKFDELTPPLRSSKGIADYLLATRSEHVDEKAFMSGLGVNPYVAGRWRAYLNDAARVHDPVFAAWREYASIPAAEFSSQSAKVTERLSTPNPKQPIHPLILAAFADKPPTSLEEVAGRYGAVLAGFDKPEPLADPQEESLRKVIRGEGAPGNIALADVEHLFKRDGRDRLRDLRKKVDAFKASNPAAPPRAMVLEDAKSIEGQHVFVRGNQGNQGEAVKPHFLSCIAGQDPKPFTQGSGRLELAQAIASTDNPLTARVMVNRIWLHHFGYGIVRTPSDFGTRSDPPTHPELLDYLALRFMQSGWSIKQLHRLILLSSTYRMSSDSTPEAVQADPQNLLLAHFNRQRLDFESTRDALLCVGGKIDSTMFGRSVDITTEPYSMRRSVYAYIDRQNLPGVFRNFDFASPDATCPRRFNTTVPQQALFMMNSPFFIEQAKHLLERPEVAAATEPRQKINVLYRLLFNRMPGSDEMALGTGFIESEERSGHEAVVWQYGFGEYDETAHCLKQFTPFTHFDSGAWHAHAKFPDPVTGHVSLTARGGHPGNDAQHAAVRRWVSPRDGTVKIVGTVAHKESSGDGVRARIVSSRSGELASWNVFQNEAQTNLESVQVKKGDTIDFVVDCRGGPLCDSFAWAPTVLMAEVPASAGTDGPAQWSAASDFGGPEKAARGLAPWEKYVQVLLESNEFVFID